MTIDPAAAAINAATAEIAAMKAKAEQEAKEIKAKAEREAKEQADRNAASTAAMKAKAEQEAKEIKAKAEREAKEHADRNAASTATMKAKAEQEIAEMKAKAEKERIQTVPAKATVRIIGATGPLADAINGIYEATTEFSGDMPVYAKVGDDGRWLVYVASSKNWNIQSTANKGGTVSAACCAVLPQECPTGKWQEVVDDKLVPQSAVTTSVV